MEVDNFNNEVPPTVLLRVEYPERPSRLLALLGALFFVKVFLLIPHLVILYALGLIQGLVIYFAYWAVLITGRYPRGLFNFGVGVTRWNIQTMAWMNGWTDSYPPFSLS